MRRREFISLASAAVAMIQPLPLNAQPSGKIWRIGVLETMLSGYSTDLEAKRAQLVKELVPSAARIAGLYNMGNPVVPPQWDQLRAAARQLVSSRNS